MGLVSLYEDRDQSCLSPPCECTMIWWPPTGQEAALTKNEIHRHFAQTSSLKNPENISVRCLSLTVCDILL